MESISSKESKGPSKEESRGRRENELEQIRAYLDSPRWEAVKRPYGAEEIYRLRGTIPIEYSIARQGAEKLWNLLASEKYVATLGALTGNQAVQMVQAGLKALYLSGWQVAADNNLAGKMYPDQSLYPSNSVPSIVRKLNQSLLRADQIQHMENLSVGSSNGGDLDWMVPIVADGEAGFGGPLNVFELTREMIEAGAAAVHYEDQLSSEKKCGHLGGKVVVPTSHFIRSLIAARFAADVMGVPTVLIARTDANGAKLITSDIDPYDQRFLTGERTAEGFYRVRGGLEAAISRALAYAPYCDMIWCETATPDLEEATRFAQAVHKVHPGKLLAYNCSPSFNWEKHLNHEQIRVFQAELSRLGYKFQFITLAGFHALNYSMFELASEYAEDGMPAFVKLQQKEFEAAELGYTGVKHQRFVGTSYFDEISQVIQNGSSSTLAMKGSTEEEQFAPPREELKNSVKAS